MDIRFCTNYKILGLQSFGDKNSRYQPLWIHNSWLKLMPRLWHVIFFLISIFWFWLIK